jgi:hypothetical protein
MNPSTEIMRLTTAVPRLTTTGCISNAAAYVALPPFHRFPRAAALLIQP